MNYKEDNILEIINKIKHNKYNECSSILDAKSCVESRLKDLRQVESQNHIGFRYKLLLRKLLDEINIKKEILIKSKLEESYESELFEFLNLNKGNESDKVAFIFSGTNRKESFNTSRPIKLSIQLKNNGVPVIYSTWKWEKKEDFEKKFTDGILFESPINKTLEHLLDIIKYNFEVRYKIFIITFPYPDITKYIETLKFYGWIVIYDIMDDWEEFHKVKQAKWYKKEHELYLIKKSNIVTAVASPLIDKFKNNTNQTIYLIPNALDHKFIDNYKNKYIYNEKNNTQVLNKFKNMFKLNNNENYYKTYNKNKIGYVGHLTSSWFDWESLIEIAKTLPQYTFEIIGHGNTINLNELPDNINYLGSKSIDEVFHISKDWKIGIIPFKIGRLSEGVDPIKVYEYLAMGLKVISFSIPQIVNYPEVKVVNSIEGFVEAIKISMEEEFNYIKVEKFLKTNTWKNRIDCILELSKNISEMSENN